MKMKIDKLTKKLRDAIAEATPGPWVHTVDRDYDDSVTATANDKLILRNTSYNRWAPEDSEDFAYIALANPANITLLLDTIDKLNGKLADYRAQELKAQEINLALEKKFETARRDALTEAIMDGCYFCKQSYPYDPATGMHQDGEVRYDCFSVSIRALIDKPAEKVSE